MQKTFEELIRERLFGAPSEAPNHGVPDQGEEAITVFKSIVTGLLFVPKTALYFALLAKNGLSQAIRKEIDLLDELSSAVQDLGNPVYDVNGTESLALARSALLHLEQMPRVDAGSPAFVSYKKATDAFLEKELAPNVGAPSAQSLLRSSAEAVDDMHSTMESLKAAHLEVLDRLYRLSVGIDNFLSAPLQTMLGNMTVNQVRKDLEDVIVKVEDGSVHGIVRNIVMQLIAGREMLSLISRVPAVFEPLLPDDSTGTSDPASASLVGEFSSLTLPTNPAISVSVSGGAPVAYTFFIGDSALLVSSPVTFPVTVPAGQSLYLSLDSTMVEVPLAGTYATVVDLVSAVNLAAVPGLSAAQFALDPARWLLYSTSSSSISVASVLHRSEGGVVTVWDQSAHALVGLEVGQEGTDELQLNDIIDAINSLYPSLVTASTTEDGQLLLSTVTTEPGTTLTVEMPDLSDTAAAVSASLHPDDEALLGSPQVGDLVQLGEESSTVISKTSSSLTLQDAVTTCSSASMQVTSRLVLVYGELSDVLQPAYASWVNSDYANNLTPLDRVIAPLDGNKSEAQRNTALAEITKLRGKLSSLLQGLLSVVFPSDADPREVGLANGIVEMLRERKYDRAADLLLRCDLASLLTMDEDTASYAGAMMRSTEEFARGAMRVTQKDGEDAPGDVSYSTGRG